jgi:hypothetical protein
MVENTKNDEKFYAVFRNGQRVSDSEYQSAAFAQKELEYWKNIVRRYPDGSVLDVRRVIEENYPSN